MVENRQTMRVVLVLLPLLVVAGAKNSSTTSSLGLYPDLGDGSVLEDTGSPCLIKIEGPVRTNVVLTSVEFAVKVTFNPFIADDEPLPERVYYRMWTVNGFVDEDDSTSRAGKAGPSFTTEIKATLNTSGHHDIYFNFSRTANFSDEFCPGQTYSVTFLAIPGPLTLLPPILTAVMAILFRQVLIALLLGIWMCAFFAYKYNPLTATLRTVDLYFVESIADFQHSQIAVFSFFLGGLIGVVQKSGGGLGLAAILKRLTGSRRKASIACILLGACIFFDDYSLVLIAGTSLRTMMDTANVSKEKFAYILKSLGPTLPSMIPISSWIGVQVGNLQAALSSPFCQDCPNLKDADPFIITISTLPYRFFPLLLVFTVILIAVLNRDFGPILTAERAAMKTRPASPPLINTRLPSREKNSLGPQGMCPGGRVGSDSTIGSDSEGGDREGGDRMELLQGRPMSPGVATAIEEFEGPLAPKENVPHRWFNAVIPFLITMVVTLLGMILDGWSKIKNLPEGDPNKDMTVINIFTMADSVAALIWASALACVVALVLMLLQRILTLQEYMTAWMDGVKDIIEPYMVLWLAWALGHAIQDIQTTNFLAKALSDGHLPSKYIPPIIAIIGFLMSFAAGSAFGTMGIIFPLVIPTVCKISNCNKGDILQSSAAILASSIFGNVISPIAGICILTVFASQCPLSRHIKSAALYSLIIAFISVMFGTLPVGAGWYPWYEAWIIMATLMIIIFVLFSTNTDDLSSVPLMGKLFPSFYAAVSMAFARVGEEWESLNMKELLCSTTCRIRCCRKKRNMEPSEETRLLT